jgi:hypothetical protein
MAASSPEGQTRVDRWLSGIKNNPVVAVLLLVAVFVVGVANFTAAIGKLAALLGIGPKEPPRLSVEPLSQFQTPFVLRPRSHQGAKQGSKLDVEWTGYFTLTNLGSETLVVNDVDPHFAPAKPFASQVADYTLVRRYKEGPTFNEAYVASNDRVFAAARGEPSDSLLETGPFVIPTGVKKSYGFKFTFALQEKGKEYVPPDVTDLKDVQNVVQVLVGGYMTDEATCWGAPGDVGLTLQLADGRRLDVSTETMLFVVGCGLKVSK